MLSRDQVLHVARLARLELTDAEVERMSAELSKVLDHIETIAELGGVDEVPPTPRPPVRTWWRSRTCCARTSRGRACRRRSRSRRRRTSTAAASAFPAP